MAVALQANAAPSFYGFAGGAFIRGPDSSGVAVPNLYGLTTGAANTALTGVGLISGNTSTSCSIVTVNLIVSQNPGAGVLVMLGSAVDMVTSTGVACPPIAKHKMSIGNGFGFSK